VEDSSVSFRILINLSQYRRATLSVYAVLSLHLPYVVSQVEANMRDNGTGKNADGQDGWRV
jgi:hypothetical protein